MSAARDLESLGGANYVGVRLTAEPIALHRAIQSWNLRVHPMAAMPVAYRRYLADHGLISWEGFSWIPTAKGRRFGLR